MYLQQGLDLIFNLRFTFIDFLYNTCYNNTKMEVFYETKYIN